MSKPNEAEKPGKKYRVKVEGGVRDRVLEAFTTVVAGSVSEAKETYLVAMGINYLEPHLKLHVEEA